MQFVVSKQNLQKELGFVPGSGRKEKHDPGSFKHTDRVGGENSIRITGTDLDVTFVVTWTLKRSRRRDRCACRRENFLRLRDCFRMRRLFSKKEDNEWVTVKCDRARFKMVGVARDAFPEVPSFKSAPTKIPASVIKTFIDRTIFAITQEESRYTLSGAKFVLDETGARMVTTDGHRLAYVEKKDITRMDQRNDRHVDSAQDVG